jgi:PBP1b-binding outer membrane lipoprotein LpoB
MKKITKNILSLIILFVFLSGCQALKDGLEGNKKSKGAEEFLIKKKNPLILPPEFKKLPTPGNIPSEIQEETDFNIDKILGKKIDEQKNSSNSSENSLEKSILKIIKKN